MAIRRFLFQSEEGYADTAGLTDETQLGKLTLTGIAGIALDAGNARVVNVANPSAATDAANKNYVDNAVSGLTVKEPVTAATTEAIDLASAPATIDGIALVAGDRVLVKDQADASTNGVYVFAAESQALVRAEDANSSAELKPGTYVFVDQGTMHGDSGWVLTSNNPVVLGTSALTFAQFSGLGQIVAGAGMTKTGNQLDIGRGDGIAVDADAIRVDLDVNPALALNGTAGSKKLAFLPDTARGLNKDSVGAFIQLPATAPGLIFDGSGNLDAKVDSAGGIVKDSLGLGVKIASVNELSKDASGLHVVGVPASFKIAGVAVGATVDAANLDMLTNGSNADGLHNHAAVLEVPSVKETWTASGALAKGDGVYVSNANAVSKGDCSNDTKSRVIGVAEAAVSDAALGKVVVTGAVTGVLTAATPGTRYFLGTNGQPTLVGNLPAGARTIQLGMAKNATDLTVRIFDFGKKAA